MSPHPERPVQVSRDVLGSERIPPGAMGLSVFLITPCLLQPGTDLQASLTLMALQLLKITGQSLCGLSLNVASPGKCKVVKEQTLAVCSLNRFRASSALTVRHGSHWTHVTI